MRVSGRDCKPTQLKYIEENYSREVMTKSLDEIIKKCLLMKKIKIFKMKKFDDLFKIDKLIHYYQFKNISNIIFL